MSDIRTLDIATWNIHMGIGTDGRRDLDRIASIILELDVDCIALQEVDNRFVAGQPAELTTLSHKTGYEAISGPTMHRKDGNYGNALLTRLPVGDIRFEDFSIDGCEPRGLADVELLCDNTSLRIAATHLGLRRWERRRQIERIREHLGSPWNGGTVLLGDFNEWWPWSRNLRRLKGQFQHSPAPATFSSRWPFLALDRILVSHDLRIMSCRVFKQPATRLASDHLPLRARLLLPS